MAQFLKLIGAICRDEVGATTVEKNMVAALTCVLGVLAIAALGASGINVFGSVGADIALGADAAQANAALERY